MSLADETDVQNAIGRSLTEIERLRAAQLLAVASAAVEEQTGYRFEPGSYTVGRRVRDSKVRLPATVATVSEVRSIDQCDGTSTVVTGYTLRNSTLYGLRCGYIEADFTVTDAVPDEIVALVAGAVGGLMTMPPAGVTSEMAGPYQVTFGNNSGRIYFSASDMAVLRKYTLPKPAVGLL